MPVSTLSYPSIEEVEKADRYDICKWYRRLPCPETSDQEKILNRIGDRFKELGGFTPEISKSIGFK